MSLFSSTAASSRYGVIIDIGSGSVVMAIVFSDPAVAEPQIVWSHREHSRLTNITSLEQSAKAVMTALMNAAMKFDSEGRQALQSGHPHAKITEVQCSIAAPWSYTVTKTVNYTQEKEFTITEELLSELSQVIQDKVTNDLTTNQATTELNLKFVAKTTTNVVANGYQIAHPVGNRARSLTVSHTCTLTQEHVIQSLFEIQDKLLQKTLSRTLSYILIFYRTVRDQLPHTQNACLIDISYEATEIGIIRDGTFKYCTHTPFGSFSLAREISAITDIPLEEAFGHLHTKQPYEFTKSLPTKQKEEIETMFESYIERVAALFHETGDTLSIPKHIIIRTEAQTSDLFSDLIEKAAKRTTKSSPHISFVSHLLNDSAAKSVEGAQKKITDTTLLLSAKFFHSSTT